MLLLFSLFSILHATNDNAANAFYETFFKEVPKERKSRDLAMFKEKFGEQAVNVLVKAHKSFTEGLSKRVKNVFSNLAAGAMSELLIVFGEKYWKEIPNKDKVRDILLPDLYKLLLFKDIRELEITNALKEEDLHTFGKVGERDSTSNLRLVVSLMYIKYLQSDSEELKKILLSWYNDIKKTPMNGHFSVGDLFKFDWPYTIISVLDKRLHLFGIRDGLLRICNELGLYPGDSKISLSEFQEKPFVDGFDKQFIKELYEMFNDPKISLKQLKEFGW